MIAKNDTKVTGYISSQKPMTFKIGGNDGGYESMKKMLSIKGRGVPKISQKKIDLGKIFLRDLVKPKLTLAEKAEARRLGISEDLFVLYKRIKEKPKEKYFPRTFKLSTPIRFE